MKKFNSILTFAIMLIMFASCEKSDIDLTQGVNNIEPQLTNMIGREIAPVSNQFKSEGYERIRMNEYYTFSKRDVTYALTTNEKRPHNIYSAVYQTKFPTKDLMIIYNTCRASFITKSDTNYLAQIAAEKFIDMEKGYIDSVKIDKMLYAYVYDDPAKFEMALTINQQNLIMSNETWWLDKMYTNKLWSLQFSPRDYFSEYLTLSVVCADYSLRK